MSEPACSIEDVSDIHETVRVQGQDARHRRNNAWLQTH
jgi:anti-sigma factor RsiW